MNDKNLFSSEIVRKEVESMHELYKEIYMSLPLIQLQSNDEKEQLLKKMERLIDMQEILYTRVNLSNDEDSQTVKENFRIQAKRMGMPTTEIGPEIFKLGRSSIQNLRSQFLDND